MSRFRILGGSEGVDTRTLDLGGANVGCENAGSRSGARPGVQDVGSMWGCVEALECRAKALRLRQRLRSKDQNNKVFGPKYH